MWNALQNQSNTHDYGHVTRVRIFNPADPTDPASPTAHVTVTWYLYDCWGVAAAEETLPVPPGQYNGVSKPVRRLPGEARRQRLPRHPQRYADRAGQRSHRRRLVHLQHRPELAQRPAHRVWRAGQAGHTAWISHWEHSTPLGGPEYGGRFTGAYVLYPARQKSRTAPPVPPAHVTVTHFVGTCNSSTIWRQDNFDLGSGNLQDIGSSLAEGQTGLGQGCLLVTSDQPVVAFNGTIYDISYSPVTGDQSRSEVAITFQPVNWNTAPAP